ncbi:MAG: hypothetical protein DMD33_09475 [Gemmatimonadetes bacterium]|nr:MAG: hypothetical protein DMD33_09475 [Gemmatimonadota bacterium]
MFLSLFVIPRQVEPYGGLSTEKCGATQALNFLHKREKELPVSIGDLASDDRGLSSRLVFDSYPKWLGHQR